MKFDTRRESELSSHIWNVKSPSGDTILLALRAFAVSVDLGAEHGLAGRDMAGLVRLSIQFAAYMCEERRQKGDGGGFNDKALRRRWLGSQKRGFRFTKGHNKDNYLKGGYALMEYLPAVMGMNEGTPVEIVLDHVREVRGSNLVDAMSRSLEERTREAVSDLLGVEIAGVVDQLVDPTYTVADELGGEGDV
jgi:hypothetical protein